MTDPPNPSLPTSRWRAAPSSGARGAADRVPRSQAQARATLRVALCFVGAAPLAWGAGAAAWLPLHLFLAGGLVLAISGVSLMLTVTWSAAPAPPDRAVTLQRWCIAAGAAGVAAGRELELGSAVVGVAGTIHLAGLALLGVLLVTTVRRGVERRFDPAVVAYVAALLAGTAGVGIGVGMGVGHPTVQLRAAHVVLNLLGLVGLVVGGTLPFFAATVGRARMAGQATRRRLMVVAGWQATAVAVSAVALVRDAGAVASAGLAAYACGIAAVVWLMPRPTRRQLQWAGPRLIGLWAGAAWWAGAVTATAVAATRHDVVLGGGWLPALVVAGYAQILWGSLAYLLPMLRGGGHERLGEGFAATRSWTGLVAANTAGVAFLASAPAVAAAAVAVWVVDAGVRARRVGFGRSARSEPEPQDP